MERGSRGRRPWLACCVLGSAFYFGVVAVSGCGQQGGADGGPTTRPGSLRDRQDKALKDPFGYSPGMERTDISGDDLAGFDKEGFKKDVKNVFDP